MMMIYELIILKNTIKKKDRTSFWLILKIEKLIKDVCLNYKSIQASIGYSKKLYVNV